MLKSRFNTTSTCSSFFKRFSTKETTHSTSHTSTHHPTFAKATTNMALKKILETDGDPLISISFFQSFIPEFRLHPIRHVTEAQITVPGIPPDRKIKLFDFHVTTKDHLEFIVFLQNNSPWLDKNALHHACCVYNSQFPPIWPDEIKPVISIQIQDYETEHFHSGKHSESPAPNDQFLKHFVLTDKHTNRTLDLLQLIQIELTRANDSRFFPVPTPENMTEPDWWIHLLINSDKYTAESLQKIEKIMPPPIFRALKRLEMQNWDQHEKRLYSKELRETLASEVQEAVHGAEQNLVRLTAHEEGINLAREVLRMKWIDKTPDECICQRFGITSDRLKDILGELKK